MKKMQRVLVHWLPFSFAGFLCYSTLWRLVSTDMKWWEPAFFAFLPMCFFFAGVTTSRLESEVRRLQEEVAKLQASPKFGDVAA